MKKRIIYAIIDGIVTAIFLFCFLSLIGCTKMIYVPVESVKTEYRDILKRDSIYERDSVYIRVKGDTVWLERYKYLYRDVLKIDSFIRADTIKVPYPVEKSLSRWEKTKMDAGGWTIGVLSGVLLIGIIYIVIWLTGKKKRV